MRVTVLGTGLYTGQTAIVESIAGGVIPAAVVRTEAGRTRRVRTIDLVPAPLAAPDAENSEPPEGDAASDRPRGSSPVTRRISPRLGRDGRPKPRPARGCPRPAC